MRLIHKLNIIRDIAMIVLLGVLVYAVWNVAFDVDKMLKQTTETIDDTSKNLNAVLIQVGLAANNFRVASETQSDYNERLKGILTKTEGNLSELQSAIKLTSSNLNGEIITRVATNLDGTSKVTENLNVTIGDLNKELRPVLESTNEALKGAAVLLNDPSMKETLANIDKTTAELAKITAENASNIQIITAKSAEITSNVAIVTKPKGFLRAIAPGVVGGVIARLAFKFF